MVRHGYTQLLPDDCCPHARGDGPIAFLRQYSRVALSPRTWGWSDMFFSSGVRALVVPTHVGMVRKLARL